MVELEDFVHQSLLQIHSAIKKVNKHLSKDYPDAEKKNIFLLKPGGELDKGSGIHFDLAISTEKVKTLKGGTKVGVHILSAGMNADESKKTENISKIKFTVYVSDWAGTYQERK